MQDSPIMADSSLSFFNVFDSVFSVCSLMYIAEIAPDSEAEPMPAKICPIATKIKLFGVQIKRINPQALNTLPINRANLGDLRSKNMAKGSSARKPEMLKQVERRLIVARLRPYTPKYTKS